MSGQNRTLGRFDLVGIPPAPRGVPQIEVTFDIDANGIVHVSAKDMGTGKEQKIRIESSSGLSESEIKNMVRDAEVHAEEDKKERERVEVRNESDNLIYSTDKSLKDYGDKITEDDRKTIEAAIADLKSALESNNAEEMKKKNEALKQAAYKLAEEVYKSQAADQQGQTASASESESSGASADQPTSSEETVEDADYEVVDDEDSK